MIRFAALPLALTACAIPTTPEPPPTIELRAFEVPDEHADRLASTLNHVLSGNTESPVGRVRQGPSGTLLVAAPSSVIEGVVPLIDAVTSAEPPPPPKNLSVSYWIVAGTPGDVDDDPRLKTVQTTLSAIEETDGPLSFSLITTQRISSLEGEHAEASSMREREVTRFDQRIDRDPNSGAFVGEIGVTEESIGTIDTRIALSPDQTAILAATGGDGRSIYILVRPQVL